MSRFFKSAAFPILIVVVLAFFAQKLISPGDRTEPPPYSQFLQHQSIDVTLLRRVQVLGAVRNPGLYPVDATMTISDALALAGGATSDGRPDRVELVRDGKRIESELGPETRLSGAAIQSGDQLFVPERSWLARNTGLVAAGLSTGASLIIAFLAR